MKAIVYHQYGSTEMLHLEDVPKPQPKPGEVLLKVKACSINSWDVDALTGSPFILRLIGGLFRPSNKILGLDIAGQVEAVGEGVKDFKAGDEVFGDVSGHGFGGFAEYLSVSEIPLAKKPANMSFQEAAALPHAGVLALQGLRQHPGIQAGHKVLFNGAGGGVGTLGIQLAKQLGAEVTAVDRATKFDLLRRLGADHLLDYTKENYTRTGQRYDLIIDVVAHQSRADYKRALKPGGVFVMIGGSMSLIPSLLFFDLFSGKGSSNGSSSKQKLCILGHKPNRLDLNELSAQFEAGNICPVIDEQFGLHKVPQAIDRLASGTVQGKIVICY